MGHIYPLGNGTDACIRGQKKHEFLIMYEELHNVSKSAIQIGIHPSTVYRWIDDDPEFAQAVKRSEHVIGDYYQDMVHERAQKSDLLLMFATKRFCPEYRESPQLPASYQDNRVINITINTDDGKRSLGQITDGMLT